MPQHHNCHLPSGTRPSATSSGWHTEPSDAPAYSPVNAGESYSGNSAGENGDSNRDRRDTRTRERHRERRHLEASQQQQDGGNDDWQPTHGIKTREDNTSDSEPIDSRSESMQGVEVGVSSIPLPTLVE